MLKRAVAIKVLPAAGEAERISRFQREAELLASLSHSNIAIVQSELHHDSPNNFSRSQPIKIFVELVEPDDRDGMTNLAFSRKCHDLAQIGVIAPERAVKDLFVGNPRE